MKIMTISREYGAGGREIGLEVAKRLGVTLYDRDIIREVAQEAGLDYNDVEYIGEQVSKSSTFIRRITPIQYDQNDTIFEMQKHVILDLAENGPCIFLGRCADSILHEANIDSINVFLHASTIYRAISIGKLLDTEDANIIQKEMKRIDSQRKTHYERYSGRHWGDFNNYDLMLDTGRLGKEKVIDILCDVAQSEI